MLSLEAFTRLGIFIDANFLDAELCARFCGQIRTTDQRPTIIAEAGVSSVKEDVRSSRHARVPSSSVAEVKRRFEMIRPNLEEHFRLGLSGFEPPQFLAYQAGDFQLAHRDTSADPRDPEYVRKRQLTAIIFLNQQAQTPGVDHYGGGALTLYGLLPDPQWEKCGFPLTGSPGVLVVFRSDTIHEVRPVASGERYTIVTWYF